VAIVRLGAATDMPLRFLVPVCLARASANASGPVRTVQQDADHTHVRRNRRNRRHIEASTRSVNRKSTRMFIVLSIADENVTTRPQIMHVGVKGSTSDGTARNIYGVSAESDEQKRRLSNARLTSCSRIREC
jgi:hypothetical protein